MFSVQLCGRGKLQETGHSEVRLARWAVVGLGLDSVEKVVEWRTISKIGTVQSNWSQHPELDLLPPKSFGRLQSVSLRPTTERLRKIISSSCHWATQHSHPREELKRRNRI